MGLYNINKLFFKNKSIIFLFICFTASAAIVKNYVVHYEITELLEVLGSSDCKFNRNGSWYSADQSKKHLLSKLNYIETRTVLNNTEQFIDLGASKSSWTGRPYLVKCGRDRKSVV